MTERPGSRLERERRLRPEKPLSGYFRRVSQGDRLLTGRVARVVAAEAREEGSDGHGGWPLVDDFQAMDGATSA
jgi:hypothetical protein